MSREAMKLALEALEYIEHNYMSLPAPAEKAITALREALAEQPAQPTTTENNGGKTGWPPGLLQDDCKGLSKWLSNKPDAKRRVREALDKMAENARELGIQMQPAQQEPVANYCKECLTYNGHHEGCSHHTSPPAQRKPLTKEDISAIGGVVAHGDVFFINIKQLNQLVGIKEKT